MLLKTARKIVVGLIGGTVVLIGVIMIVAPGPAFIVIPLGLAILATEFAFAARILKRLKQQARTLAEKTGALPPKAANPAANNADPPATP